MTDKTTTWEVKARSVAARVTFTVEEARELSDRARATGTSWVTQAEAEALRRLNDGRLRAVFGGVSLTLAGVDLEEDDDEGLNRSELDAAAREEAVYRATH